MSKEYQNSNYNDYMTLHCYNKSNLGIPYIGNVKSGVQIVPNFKGFNYISPNYNSLTFSDGNRYPTINTGYPNDENCVIYSSKKCNLPEDCGLGPVVGPRPTIVGGSLQCTDDNLVRVIQHRISQNPNQQYTVQQCMNDCNTKIMIDKDGNTLDCRDSEELCRSVCAGYY
jgi:hypothetical protein